MIKLILSLLFSERNKQVRLEKNNQSDFDLFCRRITPYVIFAMIIALVLLVLWVLITHGANITGTEANAYYYHLEG